MKKTLLILACLIASMLASAKPVQISISPAAAAANAQVFEKGSPISGTNGIFRVELGFLQEKTLTIQSDGFDKEQLFISFKHKQDVYEVVMKPNRKTAIVSTNVEDATIFIDGVEKGKGRAEFNIYKNTSMNIKIVADGYDTYMSSIGFNDSHDLVINKECTLYPNRKDVYISVEQDGAKVFADGKEAGVVSKEHPVKVTVNKGKPVAIRITHDGYMDVTTNIDFYDSDVTYNLGVMPQDQAWHDTDFGSSLIANHTIPIKIKQGMSRDDALRDMMYYVTKNFRDLDVNNYTAGWIRTAWNIDKYTLATKQIRTRVEIKQAPSDSDGALKFDLLIESQSADPNAGPEDQNFTTYNWLLKKYSTMSKEIRYAVEK